MLCLFCWLELHGLRANGLWTFARDFTASFLKLSFGSKSSQRLQNLQQVRRKLRFRCERASRCVLSCQALTSGGLLFFVCRQVHAPLREITRTVNARIPTRHHILRKLKRPAAAPGSNVGKGVALGGRTCRAGHSLASRFLSLPLPLSRVLSYSGIMCRFRLPGQYLA